jgi:hypothetical protein
VEAESPVPFEATVRRSKMIEPGRTVMVIERYEGEIDSGDALEVVLGEARTEASVITVAWGSGFGAEATPLTLVVSGLDGDVDYAGATLRGARAS